MILTRLYELYGRLEHDPEFKEVLPRPGTSKQKISFIVVLTPEGKLFDIQDARIQKIIPPAKKGGKEKSILVARDLIVPGGERKTGKGANPHLLWDKSEYMLGICNDSDNAEKKDKEKARNVLFPAFREEHRRFRNEYTLQDTGLNAVITFLDTWNPSTVSEVVRAKIEKFCSNFGTFAIQGVPGYVFENPDVSSACIQEELKSELDTPLGNCLITGETNVPLARIVETKVKLGKKPGSLVSFNDSAYESYGKEQTYNSPVSEAAAFKAHNALNLLISEPRYHFKLADTTMVFWTEKKTQTENLLSWIINPPQNNDISAMDQAITQRIQSFWKIVSQAGDPDLTELGDDVSTPFYMLGIEPNAARIVVRFWQESSLGDLILKLRRHAQDIAVQKMFPDEPDHIPLWLFLAQTARDSKGIPPLLSGSLLRSILEGRPYPESLYQLTLNRVNVSHDKYKVGGKVSYLQASVIKAFLTRNKKKKGLNMSLNKENKNSAYLLGRLFATLEMTQNDSSGGVNAGVGDKFYSSASATPRMVFPTILDMFRKWIKKLSSDKPGLAVVREKLVGEILDDIDSTKGFPSQLSLEDRGLFALGYYQQMRAFFTKKSEAESSADNH